MPPSIPLRAVVDFGDSMNRRVNPIPCLPLLSGLALAFSVALCACASSHFDGRVFRNDELAFAVPSPPPAWRPIEVSDALIAYRDDEARATIAINGRCGQDGDDVPLESLTQHLFIYFTEREVVDQQRLPMDDREALRTEMFAKLDGVRHAFVVYVLKKDRCVYDFMFIADPRTAQTGAKRFDRYVEGFRTMPR